MFFSGIAEAAAGSFVFKKIKTDDKTLVLIFSGKNKECIRQGLLLADRYAKLKGYAKITVVSNGVPSEENVKKAIKTPLVYKKLKTGDLNRLIRYLSLKKNIMGLFVYENIKLISLTQMGGCALETFDKNKLLSMRSIVWYRMYNFFVQPLPELPKEDAQ